MQYVAYCGQALLLTTIFQTGWADRGRGVRLNHPGSGLTTALAGQVSDLGFREVTTWMHADTISAVTGLFSPRDGQAPIVTALADYLDSDGISLFLRFQAVVIGAAPQEMFRR
jgi:hypothetical protein